MNSKKIQLFLDSNATMKSYVCEEDIDAVDKIKEKMKNGDFKEEKFNSEHCVPYDNFLFDDQECLSSIDQAFENLCEGSKNVSVLETLFGGSYKNKDNSTKLIERNMDLAAIILIQDEKLEKLRKFYFNLLEKYETQQIKLDKVCRQQEILSKKLNVSEGCRDLEKKKAIKIIDEEKKNYAVKNYNTSKIINTSTCYVDCSRNKSYKVNKDPNSIRMETSSRNNFLPNLQSTLIEPEFNGFLLRDLLECRDFNMDGTPNMTKKYNRKKYLQQGKNVDGSRDMRFKKNKDAQNQFFIEKYKREAGLPESDTEEKKLFILQILPNVFDQIGEIDKGNYVIYINPNCEDNWYKFDDNKVSKSLKEKAIDLNFGIEKNQVHICLLISFESRLDMSIIPYLQLTCDATFLQDCFLLQDMIYSSTFPYISIAFVTFFSKNIFFDMRKLTP
ncbi:ubiquitin carboxyl terminal hydrolase 7, partial [Brachionus plicatilis]